MHGGRQVSANIIWATDSRVATEANRAVDGATRSKHMQGAAFDIAMSNHDPVTFEAAARRPRNRDELVDRLRDGGF